MDNCWGHGLQARGSQLFERFLGNTSGSRFTGFLEGVPRLLVTRCRSQGPASQGSRAALGTWGCPKCRAEYLGVGAPREYRCMCGKVVDPGFDPWLLPHTCGATCDRQLQPPCGHDCVLLCHPGPCPPCPRQVAFWAQRR